MKKRVFGISFVIFLLIFLGLALLANRLGRGQISQNAAERWCDDGSVSQVSCFFSVNAGMDEDRLQEFEHSIDDALLDAGVKLKTENPGARLWADAYSADGTISLTSDRTTVSCDAIGIGGDFFLFHPLKLLSGNYFSGNALMSDVCVIDQDAAWQLFGSSNVAGMTVYISGIPHIITGVVERGDSRLEKAAGLDATLVYVSLDTLQKYGRCNGINCYELIMPNPVTGFAAKYVKEALGMDERETQVIENTTRYDLFSRVKLIPSYGTRGMNGKAIIYPYWENVARGYEDLLMVVTFFELLFCALAVLCGGIFFILVWTGKGWTIKDVWLMIKDRIERMGEKFYAWRKGLFARLKRRK